MKLKTLSLPALLVVAMTAAAAFAQMPSVAPKAVPESTPAQASNDATITSKVKDAIASDPDLKGLEVTVDTTDAVVTLNGTADSRDQISRALALAKAVAGVKSVTNILAVKTS